MTFSIDRRTQQMLRLLLQKVRQFPLTKAGLRTQKVCSSTSPGKARFVSQFIPWTRSFRFASSSSKLQVSQCIPRMHSFQHKHLSTHHLCSVRQLFKSWQRAEFTKKNSKTISRTPLQVYSHKQTRNYKLLSMFLVV